MKETERLILIPLTYSQLLKYIKTDHSLEQELNLSDSTRIIPPELKEALENTILPNVKDSKRKYMFHTLWTIISKADHKMVADLCIVGEPNVAGEIEIGYGTYDEFQRKGFMTEAVGGIIEWAKTHDEVKSIIASTEKSNVASFTVLEKNNFKQIGETESLFNWRLSIKE